MAVRPDEMVVRLAQAGDAEAMAEIYNQGIETRGATFETERRTAEQMRAVLEEAETYPVVAVEVRGEVVGFAWASRYRPRQCYEGIAEFSVYVKQGARGLGCGNAAVTGLIRECERLGFWKLVSRVFPENAASRRLCATLGFREVGVYQRHARLDGRWKDCVIVEKLIGPAAAPTSTTRD